MRMNERAMGKILLLSDIHGNLSALKKILEIEKIEMFASTVLLGDLVDYGPHSNEVVQIIRNLPRQPIVNIWGNHEKAVIDGDDSRFSSERGKRCLAYTRNNLSRQTLQYLADSMEREGKKEFELYGKKCLAVHGSLADPYWKSISHAEAGEEYAKYDIVFSGHSHVPHFFEHFYPCECPEYRNKKKTVFLNPGSVGQPRNHNPNAQYAVLELETMTIQMKSVPYEIEHETAFFSKEVDAFYSERLKTGI